MSDEFLLNNVADVLSRAIALVPVLPRLHEIIADDNYPYFKQVGENLSKKESDFFFHARRNQLKAIASMIELMVSTTDEYSKIFHNMSLNDLSESQIKIRRDALANVMKVGRSLYVVGRTSASIREM